MSSTEHYDLIIIGAGPAGSCTAIYASAENPALRILLLESKKEVGIPMQCGEAIPTYRELLSIFPEANCAELYDLPSNIYAGSIAGIKFRSPSGKEYVAELKGQMFHRDRLDQHLFQRALDNGVEAQLGTRVKKIAGKKVYTDTAEYSADIIVGADGVFSTVASSIAAFEANRDICPCALVLAEGDFYEDLIELWFETRFPGGYFWLFPKNKDGTANIGLGIRGPRNVRQRLEQVLEELSHKHNFKIALKSGGAVPLGGLKQCIVSGNVALVGDAAGMVFPTNGGGTGLALMAGKWLGEVIAQRRTLNEYSAKVDAFMKPVLRNSLRTRRTMDFFRQNETIFSGLMWLANLSGWRSFIIG